MRRRKLSAFDKARLDEERRERDTVHEVIFKKKDGAGEFAPVKALGDPSKSEKALLEAIRDFEIREKTAKWQDISSDYRLRSYWYP